MSSANVNDRLYTTMCSEQTLQSEKNGFFLQFADHVVHMIGIDWLTNVYGKLNTNRERIEALLIDKQIKDIVCETLSNVQCIYRKKNAKVARDKRLEAETFMKNGNPSKALVLYCQSVLRATPKGVDLLTDAGRTLSLALWGRSKALIELGELTAALADLQFALKEGLPDKYKPELYLRMSTCYEGQNELNRAKVALALSVKLYGQNQKELQQTKEQLKVGISVKKNNRKVLPEILDKPLNGFENASSLITLQENVNMGRYFVADKDISTGDTLIVEPPRAACLLPECFGTHCHHCFQRLLAPIGCPDCASLAFCSTECRDKAISTYHKFECKILDMLIGSGMSILCHIALRMITQDGLTQCLELYKDKSKDNIKSLCGHSDEREPRDFLQRSLMATFLMRCLQICGFFTDKTDEEKEKLTEEQLQDVKAEQLQIAELLLTYLEILQFNAHEIVETRHAATHRFQTAKSTYIAVGIYPTVALLNHDCYPGVIRYFVNKHMVIKASRPHKPGEIVAENYGPIFLKKTLAERQRSLQSRYWFKCQCRACRENWIGLDKLQNKHARYKCPNHNCDYLYSQPIREDEFKCPRCKTKVSLKAAAEIMDLCEKQYKIGFDALDAEDPQRALEAFIPAINSFHSIALPPHKDTHLAQIALRSCMADSGNVYECLVVNQS